VLRSFGERQGFIPKLAELTKDLDIGLVVSNAGTGNSGEFLKLERQLLEETLRLNTMSHLDIAHYFGRKLAERKWGGLILVGAMGAENVVPCMANDGGAKAYVHSLGEALHYEFKPLGVYVTVLAAGFTNTAVLEKFGFDPKTMPMKPLSVEQCVSVVRARDLYRSGIHPEALSRAFRRGLFLKIGRGLYARKDFSADFELQIMLACKRVPNGIVCLKSAVRFHGFFHLTLLRFGWPSTLKRKSLWPVA
jgi:NAD(P)-dependent dehydrogenase (short-subunit alcohol dehydrogenase family)